MFAPFAFVVIYQELSNGCAKPETCPLESRPIICFKWSLKNNRRSDGKESALGKEK
nr:hypothetical protein [uncultured bacterium]